MNATHNSLRWQRSCVMNDRSLDFCQTRELRSLTTGTRGQVSSKTRNRTQEDRYAETQIGNGRTGSISRGFWLHGDELVLWASEGHEGNDLPAACCCRARRHVLRHG